MGINSEKWYNPMSAYQYEAVNMSDRKRSNGMINASTEREARELLREQELIPTKLKLVGGTVALAKDGIKPASALDKLMAPFSQVSGKEKIAFTRNLSMMVRAGIPLTDGLLYYENYSKHPKVKAMVGSIRRDILGGKSFSQGILPYQSTFSEIYVNVIRAGEASGELDGILARLADLMIKDDKMKAKIVSAAVYPVVVLGIVGIVLLVMFLLVLPTFEDIYKKMHVSLPFITQVMLGISWVLRNYWFIMFPSMGALVFTFLHYIKTPGGKAQWDALLLKIPVVKGLMQFMNCASYVSTLLISFGSGLPIVEALELSANTVDSTPIRKAFANVSVQIQAGQRLASALAATKVVPDLVMLMLATGEESGEIDKMLHSSLEYLEDEVNHKVDILISMMEPCMLVVLGFIVGTLALSIYLPLFSIYENIH
jgi:type II secretory pathway component PulF